MYDYVSEEMPKELVLSELARGIDLRRDILDRMQVLAGKDTRPNALHAG
jgi:acyl CoA:acetate/3-ketoacid CoA transferase